MDLVEKIIDTYPDFPIKGILFKDIMPVFRNPQAYNALIDELADRIKKAVPNCAGLVGIESRGFMLACPLAIKLSLPFIPVRKPGKLPGKTKQETYGKEYGKDTLVVQEESIKLGQTYVVIDDFLATGGTLKATCGLIQACGAKIGRAFVVMEAVELGGRAFVETAGFSVDTLLKC